jgi:hypothetical protein
LSDIRPGLARRTYRWLHDAVPTWPMVLFGSFGWGLAMTLSALVAIWLHNALLIPSPLAVALLYFYGGSLAFGPAVMATRLIGSGLPRSLRFVVATLIVGLVTHVMTAGIFALQYRVFYAHWHAEFLTITWFFQLAFTSASAVYQFTVDSLYFYWPLTQMFFLGFGGWFALRRH